MTLFFVETSVGSCIRAADTIYDALRSVRAEIGNAAIRIVRYATEDDLDWVENHGGEIRVCANTNEPK